LRAARSAAKPLRTFEITERIHGRIEVADRVVIARRDGWEQHRRTGPATNLGDAVSSSVNDAIPAV
jgi:adenosylcobinamide amidohydrolase